MRAHINSLIIDDDPDDQEIFIMCVNYLGGNIECRTANRGVDAIALLEAQQEYVPDFIFLDVNMPKMNGIECLSLLKKIDRLRNAKIFMYSTTSEGAAVAKSKSLGATDFIIKPAKTSILKEKLAEVFGLN